MNLLRFNHLKPTVVLLLLVSLIACNSVSNNKGINSESSSVALKKQKLEDSLANEDLKELAPIVHSVAK
jgi:hypothetical protein